MHSQEALFLLALSGFSTNGGSGLLDPPGVSIDSPQTEFVAFESDLDAGDGSHLLDLADRWFLASEPVLAAMAGAGLTGLRVGVIANLSQSVDLRRLMDLGEMTRRDPPVFRIVVPETTVDVSGPEPDHLAWSDRLVYADWRGDDVSSSRRGPVLTGRAVTIVRPFVVPEYPSVFDTRVRTIYPA